MHSLKVFLHTKLDTQNNCAFFRKGRGVFLGTLENLKDKRENISSIAGVSVT